MGETSTITIGLALAIGGGIGALWWKMQTGFDEERDARSKLERELSDYKLYVSNNHVSTAALRDTENRLINALEKLAARMETLVSRVEKLTLDMAQRN
jgi:plasmid maintenance system antidote protein VapI